MFEDIKKTFLPPYNSKDLFSIFITVFIMISIPLTVLQLSNTGDLRTVASSETLINSELKVTINSPKNETEVSGMVSVEVEAKNQTSSLSSIRLTVDGKILATLNNPNNSNNMSSTFSWDTTKGPNGAKTLIATVVDDKLRTQTSTPVSVMVANSDSQLPSVGFNQPADGEYLSGASYLVKINASDNLAVNQVRLELDGKLVKTFNKVPYTYDLGLTSLKTGSHELKATAIDFGGNSSSVTLNFYKGVKGINF